MSHLSYLAVLGGCLLASVWLELALRTRVLRRPLRLLAVLACVVPLFVAWDIFAIAHVHWTFDEDQMLGYRLIADLPLEELLFFIVVPFAAVLTYEAVRSVKPHWPAGDEPGATGAPRAASVAEPSAEDRPAAGAAVDPGADGDSGEQVQP